jgi:hypothetical protein
MQNGPHELPTLLDKLNKLLTQGFGQETWSFRTKCYKNETTEAVHQAKVAFLANPQPDKAIKLKEGLAALQAWGKPFQYQEINTLIDEVMINNSKIKMT